MGACELCGREGRTYNVKVEGIAMNVCQGCSRFGSMLKPLMGRVYRFKREQNLFNAEAGPILASDYSRMIKSKREKLGMKQEHLAKRMGIKESMIHKIESNKLKPSVDLVRKFEKTLGISLSSAESEGSI